MAKKKPKHEEKEYVGAIRVQPVGIQAVDGESPKAFREAMEPIAVAVQQLKNVAMFAWYSWHRKVGNVQLVMDWVDEILAWDREVKPVAQKFVADTRQYEKDAAAWKKSPKGTRGKRPTKPKKLHADRPKCPVLPYPKACSNAIYHEVSGAIPLLNKRVVVLALNRMFSNLKTHQVAFRPGQWNQWTGFREWHVMLAGYGLFSQCHKPQPIPIDRDNCTLIPPDAEESRWRALIRVDRVPTTTKAGKEVFRSTPWVVTLKTGGRHDAKIRNMLEKCHSGEWKFCGSNLVWRNGMFDVEVSYKQEKLEPIKADPNKVAVLVPGRKRGWRLRINGRSWWLGGKGSDRLVGLFRRQTAERKATFHASYRHGGTARQGHGRQTAMRGFYSKKNILARYQQQYNGRIVREVIQQMERHGVGTLVFRSPSGSVEKTRLLCTAGAGRKGGSWPWHQVDTRLKAVCHRHELVYESPRRKRRKREGSGGAKNPGTARKVATADGNKDWGDRSKANGRKKRANGAARRDLSKTATQKAVG